ncbi:MAG: PD-(D/E)XK nuclease family protein [Bacteroidota bacterium]
MRWSYSAALQFMSCERKWYYSHKYARFNSSDEDKRQAAYLKDAMSLDEWKGTVVDTVISMFIHRENKYEKNPTLDDYINEARRITKMQFAFASDRRWEQITTKSTLKDGNEYTVLEPLLSHKQIPQAEKQRIWQEIKNALEIYYEDEDFQYDYCQPATHHFTQYPLVMKRQDVTIKGVPDLLLFYEDNPPLIVDWKVYRDSTYSHKRQLMMYAYMLSNLSSIPAKFPDSFKEYSISHYRLCEYQLLTGEKRFYTIDEQDIHDASEFISEAVYRMKKKQCHLPPAKLSELMFNEAYSPMSCENCNFSSICW